MSICRTPPATLPLEIFGSVPVLQGCARQSTISKTALIFAS
jgi:hypothetical protein